MPKTISIQSGQTSVMIARNALMPASPSSIQNDAVRCRFIITVILRGRGSSAPRHRAHDQKGLAASGHRLGQRGIGAIVRQVLLAGEAPDKWPARVRDVVA